MSALREFLQKLKFEPCESIRYLFRNANLDSRAPSFKKNRYPAVKNSWINNAFSIRQNDHWNLPRVFQHFEFWSETPREFLQCFGFVQIVQSLCDSRTGWKLPTRQSEFPLVFRPKFHLNLLRCRCKYSKPFSNSYKTLERSVTKVRHWELLYYGSGVTL